jgi:ubiquinone/menaquinone biosynthesis C-methylase UbiE
MNINSFSTLTLALIIALSPFTHAEEKTKAPEVERTRVPAHVMSHLGADWLERDDRDEKEQPYKVLEAMDLKPGDIVADIGVGTGYYARKIAKKVGSTGWVYGVDIQPEMLTYFNQYCEREKITNISPVLGVFDDPRLPQGSLDWIILADVYHEFENPEIMLKKMRDTLKPTGKICLLEYRLNGDTAGHIKKEHRMSVDQVKSEWLPAGYELIKLHEFLPSQHMFIMGKKSEK